jgi:hypothetical protein
MKGNSIIVRIPPPTIQLPSTLATSLREGVVLLRSIPL